MIGTTLAGVTDAPVSAPPQFLENAFNDICEDLAVVAMDWCAASRKVCQFKQNGLLNQPTAEHLANHKQQLELLIAFGELLSLATRSPVFPKPQVAAIIHATLGMLKDDLSIWHGTDLTEAEAEEIMQKCFPE
jgi:hypothetical protein